MKLKTLKDIEVSDSGTYAMSIELRDEAIKWIKDLRISPENIMKNLIYGECLYASKGKVNVRGLEPYRALEPMVDWIKHFFNITEEDLK